MDVFDNFIKDDLGLWENYFGKDLLLIEGVLEHGLEGLRDFFELPILLILLGATTCDIGIEGPHALGFGLVVVFHGVAESETGLLLIFLFS